MQSLRKSILVVLALFASAEARAQAHPLTPKLDSVATATLRGGRAVGSVIAVSKGADTLLFKSYGRANFESDGPLPLDAIFEIGSVTKQFTAAAILLLRDEGKLSLDDEITRWLPDFDTRGNRVTLRRLLDHTSGIMGLTEMPEFAALVVNDRYPRDSAYALIKRYPLQFRPGEAQVYNNSAYFLLGLIIEKASRMSYDQHLAKKIFEPLGMTRSSYCSSADKAANRAMGHAVQGGTVVRATPNVHTWPFAAGSICSTAGDLLTWVRALHGGKVLSAKSYADMTTPARLADGTPVRYGMGIAVGTDYRGLEFIGHGGTINGFTSEVTWYPAAKLGIVVLVNSHGSVSPSVIGEELAGQVLPSAAPAHSRFSGNAAQLIGKYQGVSRGRDMIVEVTSTDAGVAFSVNGSPPRVLPWVKELTFQGGAALLTFVPGGGAATPATELRFDAGRGGYYILKRK